MSHRLAIHLRDHLNTLIDQYEARLRTAPYYADLPPATRRDLERHILSLTADCPTVSMPICFCHCLTSSFSSKLVRVRRT